MKYRIVKRMNPLNNEESKFYAAPQYMEELTVRDWPRTFPTPAPLT